MNRILTVLILIVLSVTFVFATSYKKTSFEHLLKRSTTIAEGQVKSRDSKWVNNQIFTTITLAVEKWHKGNNQKNELRFIIHGGRVGDIEQHISGGPRFGVNDKVFVMLVKHKDQLWLNSMAMGKFDLVENENEQYLENPMVSAKVLFSEKLKTNAQHHPKFKYNEVLKLIDQAIDRQVE